MPFALACSESERWQVDGSPHHLNTPSSTSIPPSHTHHSKQTSNNVGLARVHVVRIGERRVVRERKRPWRGVRARSLRASAVLLGARDVGDRRGLFTDAILYYSTSTPTPNPFTIYLPLQTTTCNRNCDCARSFLLPPASTIPILHTAGTSTPRSPRVRSAPPSSSRSASLLRSAPPSACE